MGNSNGKRLFADEVTIADLLSHRSGLAGGVGFNLAFQGDSEMLLPADCLFEIVHHIPHMAPIGERWMYCVWGYSIAGCLIEEVTQKPLHQYLQEELFDPLSMSRTTLRLQIEDTDIAQPYASLCDSNAYNLEKRQPFQKTFFEASGGVYSTVNDLLRWSKATLNAFQEPGITGGSVLKQIPEILRPQVAVDSVLLPGQYYSLGWLQTQLPNVVGLIGDNPDLWEIPELPILGVGSHPRDIIYHQGVTVGYFSFLALFPETKSAVVVLTNAMAMSDVAEWVARLLIEALFDFPKRTNYVELSREGKRRRIQQFANMHADLAKEYAPETRLLPVDAYVGQYLNQTYNSILDVTLDPAKKDDLILAFQSRPSQRYGLRHLHGNVFEWALTHDESKRRGRYTVVDPSYFKLLFEVDPVGQVCEIVWDLDGFSTPGGVVFSRMNK
ncbi:Beta-lactamase-related protein [Penicillium angulare]|uniref:Beta-lactamase-related protein n=1 Tax=Penicillium angulare TaxID=116970 RepID=A0A9W9GEA5_9EURO|nr:Beta-lactamase-related protein [Penicillium angulare]